MGSLGVEDQYTLQSEAERIFYKIVNDPRLNVPEEARKLASSVRFTGDETKPFFPVPWKCAESQGGIVGYVGLLANTIAKERYGTDQVVEVDV